MRPIALDTNTYAGFKRGDQDCIEVVLRAEQLLVSTVVLAELLSGFASGAGRRRTVRSCTCSWIAAAWPSRM